MSQGSRFLLVSLLAGLWGETGNAAAFDDEIAALRDPEHNKLPRRFVAPKPRKEDRP